ncbi:hypothetical protein HPB48_002026 [Haemaphysalis longicornis]|uniref:Endonuclease/exonuclease/phosphatase domain-containing protein n=1 Tax=Haemaphysalis longicornis TaxID=44386 RepID=A0A9J6FLK5_HAELO|nr:hypothetical protein HPB48_002026 [Haemaphysalis longicornis]
MTITYVDKTLPTIQLDTTHLNTSEKEHVATTPMVDGHSITIVNCYWPPKQTTATLPAFHTMYNATRSSDTLLLLGDFNSPHPTWGYTRTFLLGHWTNLPASINSPL